MRTPILCAVVTAVALTAGACSTGLHATPRTNQRDFAYAGKRLTIRTSHADLRLRTGAPGGTVRVVRRLGGKAAEPGNATWSLAGGVLHVEIHCSGVVLSCDATHEITVPKGVALTVRATNGDVRGDGLRGDVTARSAFGDIDLRFAAPPGRVRVTDRNGNASVTVPRDGTHYRLRLRSRSGNVRRGLGSTRGAHRSIELSSAYGDLTVGRG